MSQKLTSLTLTPAVANDDYLYLVPNAGGTQYKATINQVRGSRFVQPVNGDFTWVNQGGGSVSQATPNSPIFLRQPNAGSFSLSMRVQNLIATSNYTVTGYFKLGVQGLNDTNAGMILYDSGTQKACLFCIDASPVFNWLVGKANSPTSYNANYTAFSVLSLEWWMRFRDNGTTRFCEISQDGENWITLFSVGRTDFLTPDQVGFFCNANGPTVDSSLICYSWEQTT